MDGRLEAPAGVGAAKSEGETAHRSSGAQRGGQSGRGRETTLEGRAGVKGPGQWAMEGLPPTGNRKSVEVFGLAGAVMTGDFRRVTVCLAEGGVGTGDQRKARAKEEVMTSCARV